MNHQSRRRFLGYFSGIGLSSTLMPGALWAKVQEAQEPKITPEMVKAASQVAGLDFNQEELEMIVEGVNRSLERIEEIRETHLDNSVPPPLYFNPVVPGGARRSERRVPGAERSACRDPSVRARGPCLLARDATGAAGRNTAGHAQ